MRTPTELPPVRRKALAKAEWTWLAPRPNSRRKQFYLIGRKLPASVVWNDMLANDQTVEEAAQNWDLPLEAIEECIRYCESNLDLIDRESEAERQHLLSRRVQLEPIPNVI
jgi:hypothetical protein